jgi:hypothetical protein
VAFVRFVVPQAHPSSGAKDGLFALPYALRDADETSREHRQTLAAILDWFEQHLAITEALQPDQL